MDNNSTIAYELEKLNRNIEFLEPVIYSIEESLREIAKKLQRGETEEHG